MGDTNKIEEAFVLFLSEIETYQFVYVYNIRGGVAEASRHTYATFIWVDVIVRFWASFQQT